MEIEKLPPQAPEIEMAVLGALMQEPCPEVLNLLPEGAFYKESHRIIFKAILNLHNESNPIDILTVIEELKKTNLLDKTGGNYYLTECINLVTGAANVEHHAKIIIEKWRLRELIGISSEIRQSAYDENCTPQEIIEKADKLLTGLCINSTQKDKSYSIEELSLDWLEYWNSIIKGEKEFYVSSYITDLDRVIGGFQDGEYVIIAGRPGMGKTALATQIFFENVKRGISGGFLSLESTRFQIVQRILSGVTGYSVKDIKTVPDPHHIETIIKKVGDIGKYPGVINDTSSISVNEMKHTIREMVKKHKIRFLIIDYLQLITAKGENENVRLTEISRAIKSIAKELNIPVFALSQLSRPKDGNLKRRPMLSDLRGSGSLEQDADVIIFIYREDYYKSESDNKAEEGELIIGKRRDGETGKIETVFRPYCMRFENKAKERV